MFRRHLSAKSRTEEEIVEGRSLIYTRNKTDPSTIRCGTLDVIAAREDAFLLRTTC